MLKSLIALTLAVSVVSCATNEATQLNAPKSTEDRLGSAVVAPLNDLNLAQPDIPAVLTEATKNPYRVLTASSCESLTEQIRLLDKALGPDVDSLIAAQEKSDLEKGTAYVQNEAVGSVERTIEGFVPFRSWIRKLSGAEKRSKDLNAAIAAGVMRRAFLKGIGLEHGCEAPAAPLKHLEPEPATNDGGDSTTHSLQPAETGAAATH